VQFFEIAELMLRTCRNLRPASTLRPHGLKAIDDLKPAGGAVPSPGEQSAIPSGDCGADSPHVFARTSASAEAAFGPGDAKSSCAPLKERAEENDKKEIVDLFSNANAYVSPAAAGQRCYLYLADPALVIWQGADYRPPSI